MKKILLLYFIIIAKIAICGNYEGYVIISDFDDSYKITNTTKAIPMVWNAFFTSKVFGGMATLYKEMQSSADSFVILSNTPKMLRKRVERQLKKSGLNGVEIFLYDKSTDRFNYKYNRIVEMLERFPNSKFILIGDDSGSDHLIYKKISENFAGRVACIYIRPVKAKELPEGIIKYTTAADIAANEMEAGRLSNDFYAILNTELQTTSDKFLYPRYIKSEAQKPEN